MNSTTKRTPLLKLSAVSKAYLVAGDSLPVIRDVSLTLAEAETVSIAGPSGSGKSTLLNMIGGLDRCDSGSILFRGDNINEWSDAELTAYRSTEVGFVFQHHHLLPQLTALENVLIPTLTAGTEPAMAEQRARELLEKVGLTDRLAHRPYQLSGGERQRVAVARALVNEPALLLADEPTGSLDRRHAESLIDLLLQLNLAEDVALILVTHALDDARRLGRVMKLKDGSLEASE